MGRVKPAWFYQRKATAAEAREDYLRNNPPAPPTGAIDQRGASREAFYRSLLLMDGNNNPLIFQVTVPDDALLVIGNNTDPAAGLTAVGLKAALDPGEAALRLRGSGVKPTRIHWYEGATTPTRESTPWGTRFAKYYEDRVYSLPFSEASGVFNAHALRTSFTQMFGSGGSKRSLLGTKNGRAWLDYESAPISATT
jgi:hypothetical protein